MAMNDSKIEWTDATWNPIRGCSRISPGCVNCYAERMAARFSKSGQWGHGFARMTESGPRWTGKLSLVWDRLKEPLGWREPRRIFVNSMSDLFHEALDWSDIALVWKAMRACPKHTFQVLTKRALRMRDWLEAWKFQGGEVLRNVWCGVSVEDQESARARVPDLVDTHAAVRFLSCEPLLGPVNIREWLMQGNDPGKCGNCGRVHGFTRCPNYGGIAPTDERGCSSFKRTDFAIDWVIVGGESGPGARECRVGWVRSIVEQCKAAHVPVFVKQLGAHVIDRNDAGFDGTEPDNWPDGTETDDWHEDPARQYQGADARILLADPKGGDLDEWPEDLRIREFPEARA